jgi:uncharacterized DUF497 family protein
LEKYQFRFEWDDFKAASSVRKHGVSFDLARSVFSELLILTVADVDHGDEIEERWFSVGTASRGAILPVAYLWIPEGGLRLQQRLAGLASCSEKCPRFRAGFHREERV